jgi:hypothetical protein
MSGQDSLACLTVQQFLRLCNWEGKQQESHYRQQQPQSFKTSWKCFTLQEFFSRSNWEGQAEAGEIESRGDTYHSPPRQISWQCISVKEFFSQFNWQEQPLVENSDWQHLDPYSRLKQQVREFFQFIPWEGNPEIGKLPKASAALPLSLVEEPTFTDLSDLF